MLEGGSGRLSADAAAAAAAAAREAARRAAEEARRRAEEAAKKAAAEAAKAAAEKQRQLQAALAQERNETKVNPAEQLQRAKMMNMGEVPWDADKPKYPKITAEDLKASPELGQDLAKMRNDPDPDVRAYVEQTAQTLVEDSLKANLKANKGEAVFDGVKNDVKALTEASGLGDLIEAKSKDAVENVAKDLLDEGVDAKEVADNPALGQVLSTLQNSDSSYVKDKLKDTVRGWTDAALKESLDGKKGEGGVKDAMNEYRDTLRKLGEASGMSGLLREAADKSLDDKKDQIKDIGNEGKAWYKKAIDFVGDMAGDVLDFAGDVLDKGTDLAADALNTVTDTVADGVRAGTKIVGEAADDVIDAVGTGARHVADATAEGLDAVGLDGAADATRAAGKTVEQVADTVGDVAETVAKVQGQIVGGAVDITGDVASGVVRTAGNVADGALDVAGTLAAEGPMGAAEKLADKAIGPEVPAYAGQIDGLTGVVANRLDNGDGVFMNVEAGAKVGVGAFAGGKLTGGAMLNRDNQGNLTLSLSVGVEGEAGVSAKTGAEVNGVGASADAKASVVGNAEGKITLKFNPDNPEDAARLKALIEPSAGRLAKAALNPLAAAAPGPEAVADAMKHNLASTEVMASGGAKVSASASADLGVAEVKAGIDGSVVAGTSRKFHADGGTDTKTFFKAGFKAEVSAEIGSLTAKAGFNAAALEGATVKRDASGEFTGMKLEYASSVGASAGVTNGASGTAAEGKTSKMEVQLTGKGVEAAKKLIDQGKSPMDAFNELAEKPNMTEVHKTTTDTDSFTIGGKFDVGVAGVRVGATAQATLGKTHTESTRVDGPDFDITDLGLINNR